MIRNRKNLSKNIFSLITKLPFFKIENLKLVGISTHYLRTILTRYTKRGELIRLKKGVYTSKIFIEETKKEGNYSAFLEFLANEIYSPSYLSLDYILYQENILTEIPVNFTLITKNKTAFFSNVLGSFFYHKIKDELFCGFEIIRESDFIILKATRAKALFDFLYLRKNLLVNKKAIKELRLNLNNFSKSDIEEFKKYLEIEGSKKMKEVSNELFK